MGYDEGYPTTHWLDMFKEIVPHLFPFHLQQLGQIGCFGCETREGDLTLVRWNIIVPSPLSGKEYRGVGASDIKGDETRSVLRRGEGFCKSS